MPLPHLGIAGCNTEPRTEFASQSRMTQFKALGHFPAVKNLLTFHILNLFIEAGFLPWYFFTSYIFALARASQKKKKKCQGFWLMPAQWGFFRVSHCICKARAGTGSWISVLLLGTYLQRKASSGYARVQKNTGLGWIWGEKFGFVGVFPPYLSIASRVDCIKAKGEFCLQSQRSPCKLVHLG